MRHTKTFQSVFAVALTVFMTAAATGAFPELPPGEWRHIIRQTPEYDIDTILAAPDGSLWVGAGSAFHSFSDGTWRRFTYDSETLANHSPYLVDSLQRLYFIDSERLTIWNNGVIERCDGVSIGLPVTGCIAGDGVVYTGSYHGTLGGVFAFDGTSVERIADWRTRSIAVDGEGRIWATVLDPQLSTMRLKIYDGSAWTDRTDEIGFLFPVTTNEMTVQVAPDGTVWVCNLGKYGVLRGSEWTFRDGGRAPVYLSFDAAGGVWGYGSRKIYRLDEAGNWREWLSMSRGTTYGSAFMAVDTNSGLWTFDGNVVYKHDGIRFMPYTTNTDLATNMVTCLAYTEEGDLICGHGLREISPVYRLNQGLSMRIGDDWVNGKNFDDVEFTNVFQLKMTPDDDLVAYTDGGFKVLLRRDGSKNDSLFVGNQTDMAWIDYTMWITTNRGLIEWVEGPEFEFYFPLDGDIAYTLKNLTVDSNRKLYMQTEKGDVVTYDGTEWFTVVRDDGFTRDIAVDNDDVLWAARQRWLSKWDGIWERWIDVEELDVGRLVEIDPDGRVWAASNGITGYIENGVWHRIHELDRYSCDAIAFAPDGRVAVNLFNSAKDVYYGIYEFVPSTAVGRTDSFPRDDLPVRAWPNPFNPVTTISFDLSSPCNARIDIFSVTGQHVVTLADRIFTAGRHSVIWDTSRGAALSTGVYLYRMRAGNRTATGKLLLLK